MAHAIAHKLAAEAGLLERLEFDSAGTHAHHLGERPDPRAQAALIRHGYNAGSIRSRKVTSHDFHYFDLILAMDRHNLTELQRQCPVEHQNKLRLFLSFAESLDESIVPDPYYGNAQGFERVIELCEAGASGLLRHCDL